MSLRYKILLALTAVMILILGILTFHLWITAWGRIETNQRGMAELLKSVAQDWLAEVHTSKDWETLKSRLNYSTLFTNWVIVDENLLPVISAAPISNQDIFKKDKLIAEVMQSRQPIFRDGYVIAPLIMPDNRLLVMKMETTRLSGLDFNPIESVKTILVVMPLGTLILILSMYILLTKLVLNPIEMLSKASMGIASGNYQVNLPITRSKDEIAQLVTAFRTMAKELHEYQTDMEGKIQEARERIQATEAQLIVAQRLSATGTLAAGIAHEINNPLGGILNAADALKKGQLDKSQTQQYLDIIIDGLLRIQDILKKILQSFSHRVSPQPLDLKIIIERAISLVRHRIDENKITLSNTIPFYLPQVFADATELQQVFLNLLMNAVDAIVAKNSPDKKIEIFHESNDKLITISIRDSGIGMDKEQIDSAFDMFYTTKQPGQGTGLGLSVAYNIIQNHGGKITIQSEKNIGTTVKSSLPVLRKKIETMIAAGK
ncbi:MAG: HAMP domain-containing sensor histidine kinase [Planctomycetota bacterium]|nr:HAMP domain-containing sensor histidine kinase [Planctomycetota bacterium]MDI6787327.1 HAMP domain-containing sensor histidine kinase [Planctomycetota bacterium]